MNQTNISGSCGVQGGVPYQMAVLINDTNPANADWVPYSPNFTAPLGATDGVYAVRVLWRGNTTNFPPVWDDTEITLDRVAPTLVITNPIAANATVTKPYLQLLGNANEPLAALTYDLTNALGWRTNLPVSVIEQEFDTNAFDFTTNWFQAFDVALATNDNHLTLRVTDRAGNTTMTNLTVTLDYTGATNPPVLQLTWPTNGMTVAGDSFYVRGQINDETAVLTAQIVDENGLTNDYAGLVERNGTWWLEGLPLADGTNLVNLTAMDAAGNPTQTSLSVIKSALAVNLTSTPEGESLYDSVGNVSGTVGDAGCSVSVNGVVALVDGSGNWSAENVPIYGEGTATFDVVATPASGVPVHLSVEKEKPAVIKVTKHLLKQTVSSPAFDGGTVTTTWLKDYKLWRETVGSGQSQFRHLGKASSFTTTPGGYDGTDYSWSDTNVLGTAYSYSSWSGSSTGAITDALVMSVPDRQLDHLEHGTGWTHAYHVEHYYARGVRHEWPAQQAVETLAARTEQTLFTGGKGACGALGLHCLTADVGGYGKPAGPAWYYTPGIQVAANQVTLNGETVDSDYTLYAALPNNAPTKINLEVKDAKHVRANAGNVQPRVPIVFRNSGQLTQRETNNVGYQTSIYDAVTNYTQSTALGTGNPTVVYQGKQLFFNFVEVSANVPTNTSFDSGWKWHQDISDKAWTFIRNPGTGGVLLLPQPADSNAFTSPEGGEGEGNDGGIDAAADKTPDLNRLILFADAPGPAFSTNNPPYPLHDVVLVHRFYGRTWLTWNGALASDVLHWKSFCTVRRFVNGNWERKGANIVEEISAGNSEAPAFTSQEGIQVLNEP